MVDIGYDQYKELVNNNGTEGSINPSENNPTPSPSEIQTETPSDEKNPSLEPAQPLSEEEGNDIMNCCKKVIYIITFIIISLTLADFILSCFVAINILILIDSITFIISSIYVLFCLAKNKDLIPCLKILIFICSIFGLILRYIGNILRTDIFMRKNTAIYYSIIYMDVANVLLRISYLITFCSFR